MFKVFENGHFPLSVTFFKIANINHDSSKPSQCLIPNIRTFYNESGKLLYVGPKIWNFSRSELKDSITISKF